MKLYTNTPFNFFTQTTLVVADMAKVQVEVVVVSKEEQESKEFKDKKLIAFPFLETDDGQLIFESSAVATYFARCAPKSGLYGQTPFQQAKCDEWMAWNQFTFSAASMAMYGVFGHKEIGAPVFNETVKNLKTNMMTLNKYLDGKYYLVGDSVTIADVMVASYLIIPFQTIFDGGYRKAIPHVTEWFERMVSLPSFVKSVGYVKLSEKAFKQWDPNAKVEPIKAPADKPQGGNKGGDKKKGKDKKEEKPKKDDDDDFDLFGDDDDDGAAAKAAAAKAKEAAKGKKKKKEVIAMSLVLLEVKPMDDKTDLDALAKQIFSTFTQEGLYWKTEYKKEPVAFGIFKLIIGFSLEDEKVSVDDIVEKIEGLEDHVQSVEIQAFNKI